MRSAIELRLLQCVVTLAEELSFTRAARRLYLAQPALSRHIRELEKSLSVTLFDRSTRKVTLTPAGMAFIEEARAALIHSERAQRLARAVSKGGDMPISIGFSPHFNFDLLDLIRKRAEQTFGSQGVFFTSSFTREQVQWVLDGTWDAGLCFFPVEDPGLEATCLIEEAVGVVVPSNHKSARNGQRTVRYSDLKKETVIRFSRKINPGFSRDLESFWAKVGFKPKAILDVNTIAEVLALVAAGRGIGYVKSSLRIMLPSTVKMLDFPPEERLFVKMGILYRKHGRSPGADRFLKMLSNLKRRAAAGA